MLRLGPACRVIGCRPELVIGLVVVADMFEARGFSLEVRHMTNGSHSRASLHYTGCAADMRIHKPTQPIAPTVKLQLVEECTKALGQDYDFIIEDLGMANEHFHLEYQPKDPYK